MTFTTEHQPAHDRSNAGRANRNSGGWRKYTTRFRHGRDDPHRQPRYDGAKRAAEEA